MYLLFYLHIVFVYYDESKFGIVVSLQKIRVIRVCMLNK